MSKSTALTPLDEFRGTLDKMRPQFQMALPPHVNVEKFVRVVATAVQQSPDLLNCDKKSLYGAAMRCAQDGLLPDGREAALTKFGDKVQYMPMVGGILKKVRNSGDLLTISANVVYEKDHFDYILGDDEKIEHKPHIGGDPGKPILTYAIAKTKDGGIYREVMTETQIQAVRNVSRAKNNGPWSGPFADEMRKKTAIRRLSKRLPMSTDLEELIRADDDLYDLNQPQQTQAAQEPKDVTGEAQQQAPSKRRPSALQKVAETAAGNGAEAGQQQTGTDAGQTIDGDAQDVTGEQQTGQPDADAGATQDII